MKICFFGTYNLNYSRNNSLREGLKKNNINLVEVNIDLPNARMELSEDFTLKKSLWRIARKLKAYGILMLRFSEIMECDYIVVLHPGHLDIPFAWLIKVLGRKKLFFDTSISPYDTMFVGRNIAKKNSIKARLVKNFEKLLLSLPDKLFVDTSFMKNFISHEFNIDKKRIFVVPLGASTSLYKQKKQKPNSSKDITVLFFGMYSEIHGAFTILYAAKFLKDNKKIKFTMLGDGHLKKDFMNYVEKNKLSNVKFVGFQPENELVKYIQNSDIMLGIFSDNFIFDRAIPNKVFASLACGKALITARKAPMEEFFVDRKHVYYCNPNDPQGLAKAINHLSSDFLLRESIAVNGYKIFNKNFTDKKIGEIFVKNLS